MQHNATLRDFLSRDNINLEIAAAREFLGRTNKKYDSILISWWGAGTSHSVGTVTGLAEYLYTKEAFLRMIELLNEDGTIVIFNGSKLQVLATLRAAVGVDTAPSFRSKVIIAQKDDVSSFELATADYLRLIFKPSGFSKAEEVQALERMEGFGYTPVLTPSSSANEMAPLARLANGESLKSFNADLIKAENIQISPITDNWPYLHNLIPEQRRFNVFTWFSPQKLLGSEFLFRISTIMTAALLALTVFIIDLPFLLKSGLEKSPHNKRRVLYIGCIGIGFMLIEIGFVRKFGLLLGHPSLSISIVLAALILSTGIGALLSSAPQFRNRFSERAIAIVIAAYTIAILVLSDALSATIIGFPVVVKSVIIIALLIPLGIFMGQLFPRGLENAGQANPRLVPWIWGINATASTAGVALSYTASFMIGVNELILMGAAFYVVLPRLPDLALERASAEKVKKPDPAPISAIAS